MSLQPYTIDGGLVVRGPSNLTGGATNVATPAPNDNSTLAASTEFVQKYVSGILNKDISGSATVYLTSTEIGNGILNFTGTIGANINVVIPIDIGRWIIANNTTGAYTLTVKTNAGSGVAVKQGYTTEVWSDGTNVYQTRSDYNNIALTGTPTVPTASPGNNSLQASSTAFVQNVHGGIITKSVAGGVDVTLSSSDVGYGTIKLTGALTANINVIVPSSADKWTINNATSGSYTITVKTSGGSGIVLSQGKTKTLYCDGTNVLDGYTDFNSIAITGTSTAITGAVGDNSTQVATDEFVQREAATAATTAAITYSIIFG